ncbi:unnamed protein product [Cylicocyclus nassatus]|uniref:Pseudouridylate synthase RPUSD4, mitochondrial n=1 Tax=Cylicocyclus nassatus TaxID=53992 RepID=A0AA36GTW2_CYLNA|nr:unnamed protein product [Cylicocyclus nassatus]
MSGRSAADDFFGIEYMSTQQSPAEKRESEEDRSDTFLKKTTNSTTSVRTNAEETDVQLSGTEFLDQAFFGEGLKRHEKFSAEKDLNQSQDFFEENFFKRKPLKDMNAGTSPESHLPEELRSKDIHQERAPVKASRKRRHVEKKTKEPLEATVEEFEVESGEPGVHHSDGLDKIRSKILPVWRLNQDELIDLMMERVVYSDDNIVAFDKPYGMAYSGASPKTPQLDRILQKLKGRIAPKCERLHLVKSLDMHQSGVIVFATNSLMQSTLKDCINSGQMEQVSRCIVRGELTDSPLKITIPLIKTVNGRDMKMMPLVTNKAKGEIFYVESECRTIRGNQYVSSVEAITHKEAPHQVRAHLGLAGCPLIGDAKYSTSSPRPPRLSYHVLNMLGITDSQSRKIPMYLHVKEVNFPGISKPGRPLHMSAPLPEHFSWMLKKLKLLKLKH